MRQKTPDAMNLLANLTRRESQVAELLAWGASRKEAADQLNICLLYTSDAADEL